MGKRIITNVERNNNTEIPFSEYQPSQEEKESLIRRIQESESKNDKQNSQDK